MIVCVCHRVSDRDIAREVSAGCSQFAELQGRLRVATGCGACRSFALQTLDEQLATQGAACGGCTGAARCGSVPMAMVPATA